MAGWSSSPPIAAPTTNAPTSTVTSRSVAGRRCVAGDARHRGDHRGVGRSGDRDGQRAAGRRPARRGRPPRPRAVAVSRTPRATQGQPHDQVAAHGVGEPRGEPGDGDVGQHPGAAGEAEQPRVVGVGGDHDEQQRPGEGDGQRADGVGDDRASGRSRRGARIADSAAREDGGQRSEAVEADGGVAAGVGAGREQPHLVALGERRAAAAPSGPGRARRRCRRSARRARTGRWCRRRAEVVIR